MDFDLELAFFNKIKLWTSGQVLRPKLFIAVSGGPDSVLVSHLIKKYSIELDLDVSLCHFFHGWSAFDSIELEFCRDLAKKLSIPLVVGSSCDIPFIKNNGSKEEFARQQRRSFFDQLCQKNLGATIVLGHNSDDQVETFFIRIARGSGLRGLCAMQYFQAPFLRPLLDFSKMQILELNKSLGFSYLIDPDNQNKDRLRNRIRIDLLPRLSNVDSRFGFQIKRVVENLQKEHIALEFMFNLCRSSLGLAEDQICILDFFNLPEALQWHYLVTRLSELGVKIDLSTAIFFEFKRFLESPHGGRHFIAGFKVIKKNKFFKLEKN